MTAPEAAAELAAEVLRRNSMPRSGTVRFHLETNPDMVELCMFFNPTDCTWTAYPVGGVFSTIAEPDYVATAPSPEAALAAALALEVRDA